jgi:hypothetical protein
MDHEVETPEDGQLLAEVLATNRELVEVNRQIAASLASLERLYSEDLHQRQKLSRHTSAMMRRLDGNPLQRWPYYAAIILIPALIILMPMLMRWLGP